MANGVIAINTKSNPAFVPPAAGTAGLIYGVVVADAADLTAALAASVPQYAIAIVLSTKQIFVTEDNANWTAYS